MFWVFWTPPVWHPGHLYGTLVTRHPARQAACAFDCQGGTFFAAHRAVDQPHGRNIARSQSAVAAWVTHLSCWVLHGAMVGPGRSTHHHERPHRSGSKNDALCGPARPSLSPNDFTYCMRLPPSLAATCARPANSLDTSPSGMPSVSPCVNHNDHPLCPALLTDAGVEPSGCPKFHLRSIWMVPAAVRAASKRRVGGKLPRRLAHAVAAHRVNPDCLWARAWPVGSLLASGFAASERWNPWTQGWQCGKQAHAGTPHAPNKAR
eukprot:365554-Chlamydomonas_euryale.AAC.6